MLKACTQKQAVAAEWGMTVTCSSPTKYLMISGFDLSIERCKHLRSPMRALEREILSYSSFSFSVKLCSLAPPCDAVRRSLSPADSHKHHSAEQLISQPVGCRAAPQLGL